MVETWDSLSEVKLRSQSVTWCWRTPCWCPCTHRGWWWQWRSSCSRACGCCHFCHISAGVLDEATLDGPSPCHGVLDRVTEEEVVVIGLPDVLHVIRCHTSIGDLWSVLLQLPLEADHPWSSHLSAVCLRILEPHSGTDSWLLCRRHIIIWRLHFFYHGSWSQASGSGLTPNSTLIRVVKHRRIRSFKRLGRRLYWLVQKMHQLFCKESL